MKKAISLAMIMMMIFSMALPAYAEDARKTYTEADYNLQEAKELKFEYLDMPLGVQMQEFDYSKYGSIEKIAPVILEYAKKQDVITIMTILINKEFERDLSNCENQEYIYTDAEGYALGLTNTTRYGDQVGTEWFTQIYFGKDVIDAPDGTGIILNGKGQTYSVMQLRSGGFDFTYGNGDFIGQHSQRYMTSADNLHQEVYHYINDATPGKPSGRECFFSGKWEWRTVEENDAQRAASTTANRWPYIGKFTRYQEYSPIPGYSPRGRRIWSQSIYDDGAYIIGTTVWEELPLV